MHLKHGIVAFPRKTKIKSVVPLNIWVEPSRCSLHNCKVINEPCVCLKNPNIKILENFLIHHWTPGLLAKPYPPPNITQGMV